MTLEQHRTAHNRPATVKGVNDMGESMSKAEAVYELMAMARGGGISRRQVEALQVATRSLCKRWFNSAANLEVRRLRRKGVESCS